MPEDQQPVRLDSPVSGSRGRELASELRHHDSRMAIKEVVTEHIASSDFATRVKIIQLEALESTEAYKKIADKVQTQVNQTLSDNNLKSRHFWVPVGVSVISALVAIASVIVAVTKG